MSLRLDGTYRCDRCGKDIGNAAVTVCAVTSTLTADGQAQVYHHCREPNPGAPNGCAEHVLVPSNLADFLAQAPQG